MKTQLVLLFLCLLLLLTLSLFQQPVLSIVSPHNTIKCNLNSNPLSTTTNISISNFLATNLPFPFYDNNEVSYDLMIEAMKLVNITHVRIPIHWAFLEPTKGQFYDAYLNRVDTAMAKLKKAEIKSLFFFSGSAPWISSDPNILQRSDTYPPTSLSPYTERLVWLIERYARLGLEIVQIWNEVNLPAFWMPVEDPQAYTNMLNASYTRVQQFISNSSHPEYSHMKNVKVSMAGMAYFSEMPYHSMQPMFYALETTGAYDKCDIVSYHPYYAAPEGSVSNDVYDFETKAKEIAYPLLAKYKKQIFATEWGWSTYTTDFAEQPFITELDQGDYIVKRLTMLMHLCFDRVYQFAMFDFPASIGSSQRDANYGMLRINVTMDNSKSLFENINRMAKPSYWALMNFLKVLGEGKQLFGVSNVFVPVNDPGNMHSLTVHNGEGSLFWFYWGKQAASGVKLNSQPIKDMIKLTGYNLTSYEVYDPIRNVKINSTLPNDLDNIQLDVTTNFRLAKFTFGKKQQQPTNPQTSNVINPPPQPNSNTSTIRTTSISQAQNIVSNPIITTFIMIFISIMIITLL